MRFLASSSSASTSSRSSFTIPQNGVVVSWKPSFPSRIAATVSSSSKSKQVSSQVLDRDDAPEGVLVARRPVLDDEEDGDGEVEEREGRKPSSSPSSSSSSSSSWISIEAGLEEFAKKMPMFEPAGRTGSSVGGKPLLINLDLNLYKAKVLARNYQFQKAQEILEKCIGYWPEDGRAYVKLGNVLSKQSRFAEARAVYEKACQATQGENPFIWQCWAVLEKKMGNIRRARELFDAATVADDQHVAAWHGWAVLELKEGNLKKARQLLVKAIKYCGGNEYIYQTLALLEAKSNRYEQARSLFKEATKLNPRSCASWLAWAQLEMQQENNIAARQLFEKAIQASPKNRFAWHVFGLFEENLGNFEKAKKLLKIGHALNPKDPVLIQSLALLEYKHASANFARRLFKKASEIDPDHQAVWFGWGWMEWKEGNLDTARKLYRKVLSINSKSESAARCLQAWGVLEQRAGNLPAARKLLRTSLTVNSQSYVTWMTWAQLEEDQGNSVRAEEIRNEYFLQRTEVADDPSWVAGFWDMFDPAIDNIKRLLNLQQNPFKKVQDPLKNLSSSDESDVNEMLPNPNANDGEPIEAVSEFDVDSFLKKRLSLDPKQLDMILESSANEVLWRVKPRSTSGSEKKTRTKVMSSDSASSEISN